MADHLDRIQIRVARQNPLHLVDTILVGIEQIPFGIGAQTGDEGFVTGDAAVDKNNALRGHSSAHSLARS